METKTYETNQRYFDTLAFAAIGCLIIGFLFNRVVSNVGFLLAGIYAVARIKDIYWLFRDRWMWTFMALAILPIIFDMYYEGLSFYKERGIMKLILVLLPSFIFAFKPKKEYVTYVHLFVILSMLISSIYTISYYFADTQNIMASYKISKVMPTLSYGDHIRISWVVVISMIMAMYEWKQTQSVFLKFGLLVYIAGQYVFLHFLGAKTGLITLYVSAVLLSIWLIPKNKRWLLIFIYTLIGAGGYLSVKTIPSLNERVNFMRYDYEHYSKGEYREGLSDAVRFYSLKAGKDIIAESPVIGTGFSKLQGKTSQWYDLNMPQIPQKDRFLPSSQLVIYWASGGILGLLVFLFHIIFPLFLSFLKGNVWFMAVFVPAVLSFTYETHLEGQLALFVYAFYISWFWYLACEKNIISDNFR